MAAPPSARWRPPSDRRSLAYYRWTAWIRLGLAVLVAIVTVAGLVHGTDNVVGSALFLLVAAFIGSFEIWKLQGIHAIARDRQNEDPPA